MVILSLIMYLLVLKPLMRVSLVSIILATIASSILFQNLALLRWGGYGKSVPYFTGEQNILIGGVHIPRQSLWVIGLMVVVLVGLYLLTNHTRIGKQMSATAADPGAASLSGVSTGRMVLLAFAISAAIGALGGIAVNPISQTTFARRRLSPCGVLWPPSWGAGGPARVRSSVVSGWDSSRILRLVSCPRATRTPSPMPS